MISSHGRRLFWCNFHARRLKKVAAMDRPPFHFLPLTMSKTLKTAKTFIVGDMTRRHSSWRWWNVVVIIGGVTAGPLKRNPRAFLFEKRRKKADEKLRRERQRRRRRRRPAINLPMVSNFDGIHRDRLEIAAIHQVARFFLLSKRPGPSLSLVTKAK